SYFVKGVMPLIWLILFTVLLQVFFTRGGPTYWRFGPFTLSQFGLVNGFYVFCRFVLIIFMSTLLTVTTTPLAIADATESL
ncbi:cobalt ABC transporter ATP-binding protein, partial [Streptococcus danieliae]|nr:cobalt ABC transporter ATP-binding protein [Streptococcus danieliae]